jgi:hypothetical protein
MSSSNPADAELVIGHDGCFAACNVVRGHLAIHEFLINLDGFLGGVEIIGFDIEALNSF